MALCLSLSAAQVFVDDRGVEFTIPDSWPEGRPLPGLKNNCVRCHIDKGGAISDSVVDFARSTHDREQYGCQSCHGGNTTDDERAHEGDFISTGLSAHMARCIECHELATRPFRESAHFSERIRFDYPNCSSCHDNHASGKGNFNLAAACTECHGARASAQTGRGESGLLWKSRLPGAAGNRIAIELTVDGPNQTLEVTRSLRDNRELVSVQLATDAQGHSSSLAMDVLDAVAAEPDLYYLVSVEEDGDALGEDIMEPATRLALSGGLGFESEFPAYTALVLANDELWLSLTELRGRPELIDEDLDYAIADVRAPMMELIHASPAEPDPEVIEELIAEVKKLKNEIDAVLANTQQGDDR